ncbi:alpha/beta hydrolase [Gordonia sp. (in: high G+C Gram-positive bacteria)]|uniref:serine aminopeptidase domain-containing protein n=1 Tax=Gordonia sp. (in: high G+C Gram-positive bacteria) TaxID=84139 RepID=UPI0025C3988E|nr:alpha/beta hydrolase [Gordonia sp. (in: high G+C Gram-positive bacteria)]
MFLNTLLAPIHRSSPDLAVLVLPGGTDFSYRQFSPTQGSALRMYPFTASIQARFGTRVRVRQAQYRVYGWNGGQASPMPHARAALDALAADHPGVPIAVIGHSMGGRIAAQLGADERVTDVLALAPWWQFADWRQIREGVRVRAIHGDADTVTRAPRTEKGIAELVARGFDADYLAVTGGGHAMLDNLGVWQGGALRFVGEALDRASQRDRASRRGRAWR